MKRVLVTGAGAGAGKAICELLVEKGYEVYAGVRKEEHKAQYKGTKIHPIMLDVTKKQHITRIKNQFPQLYALINNAGATTLGPAETISPEELRAIFDTNFFGLVALTQALLPAIRKAKGRIVNISTIAAKMTFPFSVGLCASKQAVEAFSESLRLELAATGVHVSCIRPSIIRTEGAKRFTASFNEALDSLGDEAYRVYGKQLRSFEGSLQKEMAAALDPEDVAEVVLQALIDTRPKPAYAVGQKAAKTTLFAKLMPAALKDAKILRMLRG